MYLLVNSSTPFILCNSFAFFISWMKYCTVWCGSKENLCMVPYSLFRLLDTAQSSDTHPKTIRTHFCRSLLACLRASGSEPDAATWKLALLVCVLRIVLGVIESSAVSMASLASPWQQRQIDGRDQVGHQIKICITVVVTGGGVDRSGLPLEAVPWSPQSSWAATTGDGDYVGWLQGIPGFSAYCGL